MIIEKIIINSFGQLRDTTLEFADGINVIEGQNEAGKSTIAAFIKYMLYGFDVADGTDGISERHKRINWTTGTAQGAMYVKVRGKRYLINRSTVMSEGNGRPTYKEDSSIIDLETGTPAFGKLPAGEVFFEIDRELFENTAFVGQIGEAGIDEGSVRQSIENILFSGNEKLNTERAMNKIGEKMHILLHENGAGGTIYDLMTRLGEAEEQLKRSSEDNSQILAKEAELYEIKKRKATAEETMERLISFDECYKNIMVIQTFDKLHELEHECELKTEAYNKFIDANTVDGFVPTNQYLTDLAVARARVNDAYRAVSDAQENYANEKNAIGITREIEGSIELADSLGGEEEILKEASAHQKNRIRSVAGGVCSALVALAVIVYEIVAKGALAAPLPRIAFALLGTAGVVGAVILSLLFVSSSKRLTQLADRFDTQTLRDLRGKIAVIAEARAKRDTMIASTHSALVAVENAKSNYESAKKELADTVLKWADEKPASGLSEFLDQLDDRVRAFLKKRDELLDEKSSLEITVKEIRRTLADKSEVDVRALVSPMRRKSLTGVNHDEIISGIADCREKIAEQDRLAFNVENDLAALKLRARDPAEIHAKIGALKAQIEDLKLRHKSYYIALRALQSASENLRAEISPRLGDFATRLMEIMTDKKYSDFGVSAGMKISFTATDGERRSVDFLSGGTQDMAYIAVRMALIDMLCTEKPPVCFDESFAYQDNVRAAAMMRAMKKLADDEGMQSFIFTCRQREANLAREADKSAAVFKLSAAKKKA